MVNLRNDEWPLTLEKLWATPEDFVLSTFHINLNQLRSWSAISDEVVQRDCWHSYEFAFSCHRALSARLYASLSSSDAASPKGNSMIVAVRPDCCMDK